MQVNTRVTKTKPSTSEQTKIITCQWNCPSAIRMGQLDQGDIRLVYSWARVTSQTMALLFFCNTLMQQTDAPGHILPKVRVSMTYPV